jgi:hypothetical protein
VSSFRQELKELKLVHDQCGEYAKEQSILIHNLRQSLQDQTQTGGQITLKQLTINEVKKLVCCLWKIQLTDLSLSMNDFGCFHA